MNDVSELVPDVVPIHGNYRNPAEYILRLAQFYLKVNVSRNDKLLEFGNLEHKNPTSFLFILSVGGDCAPCSGTTFLVSFLNVGVRIASSEEQFLLFGAEVDENSEHVSQFLKKLVCDLKYLESEVFSVVVSDVLYNVEFKVGAIPNDLKMLAFLGGELSNAATYFLTFANVTLTDNTNPKKTFSTTETGSKYWVPFTYSKRLADAGKVEKLKLTLQFSKLAESTKRLKITTFISSLKSRQEFTPPRVHTTYGTFH